VLRSPDGKQCRGRRKTQVSRRGFDCSAENHDFPCGSIKRDWMPSITIEQNLESRQTYLRLKGVGYMLNDPKFSIIGDSNEMLGPAGWKNQDIANGALQCL